jgi:hypothetical protein
MYLHLGCDDNMHISNYAYKEMKVYLKQCSLPKVENYKQHLHHEILNLKPTTLSLITTCQLDTLSYRGNKLRVLRTEHGLEWFVKDLLQCFFATYRPKSVLARLRSLPPSLKFKRHIDFHGGLERRCTTIAHEIMWDCFATCLSYDRLFEFYEWFMLHTEYINLVDLRASNQDAIDYFRISRPIEHGAAA